MTTHAPFPTVRRAAVGLLAALLVGIGTTAIANDGGANVVFYLQPADSTVVAGHQVAFCVETDQPLIDAHYQWYRNGVAIPEATKQFYRFTAQSADDGARYHATVEGYRQSYKGSSSNISVVPPYYGPTASRQAALAVLPATAALLPSIDAPNTSAIPGYSSDDERITNYLEFRATGNDLEWTYRFDSEPTSAWHLLPVVTRGAQAVYFDTQPPAGATSLTVRVIDDAGVGATRTWTFGGSAAPLAVSYSYGPNDATVVAGHTVSFFAYANLNPSATPAPSYQWYRNDVAIAGATANPYTVVAQAGDDGARYHVVAAGISSKNNGAPAGPTPSPKATLTVLPAGTNLPPQLVAPEGDSLYYLPLGSTTDCQIYKGFRAIGNNLTWAYRLAGDAADTWRALDAATTGTTYVQIMFSFPASAPVPANVTVRVVDDAGVAATRTWSFVLNHGPSLSIAEATPNPVVWPGPVTLSVTASDPDGDPLTIGWGVDYTASVEGGDVVFTPSGNTRTATFTKFGTYQVYVAATDGKGGIHKRNFAPIVVEPNFDVRADLNHDGVVNTLDLGIVVDSFGQVIP